MSTTGQSALPALAMPGLSVPGGGPGAWGYQRITEGTGAVTGLAITGLAEPGMPPTGWYVSIGDDSGSEDFFSEPERDITISTVLPLNPPVFVQNVLRTFSHVSTGHSVTFNVPTLTHDGNTLILTAGTRMLPTATVSITDSKGNAWSVDNGPVQNTSSSILFMASTRMEVGHLATSDTITVSFNQNLVTGLAIDVREFSGLSAPTAYLDSIGHNIEFGSPNIASGPYDGGTVTPNHDYDLIIGAVIQASTIFFNATGTTGHYLDVANINTTTGTALRNLTSGYQILSAGTSADEYTWEANFSNDNTGYVGITTAYSPVVTSVPWDSAGSSDGVTFELDSVLPVDDTGSSDTIPFVKTTMIFFGDDTGSVDSADPTRREQHLIDSAGSTDSRAITQTKAISNPAGSTDSCIAVRIHTPVDPGDTSTSTDTILLDKHSGASDDAGSSDGIVLFLTQHFSDSAGSSDNYISMHNDNTQFINATGSSDSVLVESDRIIVETSTNNDTIFLVQQWKGITDDSGSTDIPVITFNPHFNESAGSTDENSRYFAVENDKPILDSSTNTDSVATTKANLWYDLSDDGGSSDDFVETRTTTGSGNLGGVIVGKQISSYMNSGALTDRYATAIRESHRVIAKGEIWYDGVLTQTVPIVSGTVTVDRTAQNCRSGTCVIGDPSFFPTFITSPLSPFGAEMKIFSGIEYGSNQTEWVPLGVFTIEDCYAEDSTGGLPTVDFFDRSRVIQRANFYYPHDYSGREVRSLITTLVQDACGKGIKIIIDEAMTYNKHVPGGTVFTEDRWAAVQTCCALIGGEGRFGWDGNFYVVPIPNLLGGDFINIALNQPVAASSFSFNQFRPSMAVDGTVATRWNADDSDNHAWISVDFGSVQPINEVALTWGNSHTTSYNMQYSLDNTHWFTFYTNSNSFAGSQVIGTADFATTPGQVISGRYLRINCITKYGGDGYPHSIFEIAVRSTAVNSPPSVWEFNAGPGGVLVSAKRGVSRTGVANFISVTGKANGANQTPVGYAWDSDSRSPTFWGAGQTTGETHKTPFGQNVVNLSNDLLTTSDECLAYAVSQLGHYLGMARSLDFTAIPNPAIDAGDVVRITYKNGNSEYHIMDAFTIPLALDIMQQTATGGIANVAHRLGTTSGMKDGPTEATKAIKAVKAIKAKPAIPAKPAIKHVKGVRANKKKHIKAVKAIRGHKAVPAVKAVAGRAAKPAVPAKPATPGIMNSGGFSAKTRTLTYQETGGT